MNRNQFNSLDLRTQLTEELKRKWDLKTSTRVNKHSVVFYNKYRFEIQFVEPLRASKSIDAEYEGQIIHAEKGEILRNGYVQIIKKLYNIDLGEVECDFNYYDYDYCAKDPSKILEHILTFVTECI